MAVARLEQLVSQGTHFERWGAVIAGQPGLSIGCDNFRGGFDAAHHPIQLGRRDVAFLADASNHYPEFMERYRGYVEALGQAGLSAAAAMQVNAFSTEQSGYDAATELLARGEQFDALVAASDLIAIGAMRALQERGIDVPGSVSVVGFDDIPAASLSNPPLTTVMQDTRRAGEALVDTLLRLVEAEHAEGVVLPTRLVVRRSCGATPAAAAGAPATPATRR